MARRISAAGLALLKRLEGSRRRGGRHVVYRDQAGLPTIGYGHLIRPGEEFPDEGLSEAEAEALLRRDLARVEAAVAAAAIPALNDNQFAALVIFAFNIGIAAFRRSTALERLNAGDVAGAAEAMGWWSKVTDPGTRRKVESRGLARRRAAEARLLQAPVA